MTEPRLDPPTSSSSDHLQAIAKVGLNLIPYVGGAAAELLGVLITPALERRRREWMEMVADRLQRLEAEEPERFARLTNSEEFASVAIQAAQAALRSADQQKRRLLANTVASVARGTDLQGDIQSIFVRYLDELTATHVALLRAFAEREDEVQRADGYSALHSIFRESTASSCTAEEFLLLCRDLDTRVLIRLSQYLADSPGLTEGPVIVASTGEQSRLAYVTDLGKSFLQFVNAVPGESAT